MADQIALSAFTDALATLLAETFDQGHNTYYLDRGTSLFETLATISAEEASRPVSATCPPIAAQVEHTRFYLDLSAREARGEATGEVDWQASWQLRSVTPDEWAALQDGLRAAHDAIRAVVAEPRAWQHPDALVGGLAVLAHTAFHLGQIRQSLCTLKADRT